MTPLDAASLIRRFVGAIPGGVQASEWDDFMSLSATDSRIDTLRRYCSELPEQFPSARGHFVDDTGIRLLTQWAEVLDGWPAEPETSSVPCPCCATLRRPQSLPETCPSCGWRLTIAGVNVAWWRRLATSRPGLAIQMCALRAARRRWAHQPDDQPSSAASDALRAGALFFYVERETCDGWVIDATSLPVAVGEFWEDGDDFLYLDASPLALSFDRAVPPPRTTAELLRLSRRDLTSHERALCTEALQKHAMEPASLEHATFQALLLERLSGSFGFVSFEVEVLSRLTRCTLPPDTLQAVVREGTRVSLELSSAGYFLTVRHPSLPAGRVVLHDPIVVGQADGVDCGFVVFVEDGELCLECHSWGDAPVPIDIRQRLLVISEQGDKA
jgi:hypothetical protein